MRENLGRFPISSKKHKVEIVNAASHEVVTAALLEGITLSYVEAADNEWTPALFVMLGRIAAEDPDNFTVPEHLHWLWARKFAAMQSDGGDHCFFALECKKQAQGMMAVTKGIPSRLEASIGKELVYVDYLAAAPWNLMQLTQKLHIKPKYRTVGLVLLRAAGGVTNW